MSHPRNAVMHTRSIKAIGELVVRYKHKFLDNSYLKYVGWALSDKVPPQPSTLNPPPSNLTHQPSTLNPQPSTLIPHPNHFTGRDPTP